MKKEHYKNITRKINKVYNDIIVKKAMLPYLATARDYIKKKTENMKPKELEIKCSCGDPRCGKLLVVNFGNDIVELNWMKKGKWKAQAGIVLRDKTLKKFKKFLEK